MNGEVIYEHIFPADYEVLTGIMTRAFDEDTYIHTGEKAGGPNGYNDGLLLERLNNRSGYKCYKIIYNKAIIGAYTVSVSDDNVYNLEMLFLDTSCRGMQLGTKIWKDIEKQYSRAKKWIIETPAYSKRNHDFYTRKCGFTVLEEKQYANGGKSTVFVKEL